MKKMSKAEWKINEHHKGTSIMSNQGG